MRVRVAALLLTFVLLVPAQMKMSVEQLMQFVRSSLKLRHQDKQVANYLKKVTLTQRLGARDVETLIGEGAGPYTIDALRALQEASAQLPDPVKTPPPPPPPQIPPPSEAELRKVLEEAKDYAKNYDKSLPDFICMQVTRRYYDPTGLEVWLGIDTVTAKLSYFQSKEEKKVMFVGNKYVDIDYEKLGGTTSTGEFGSMLKEIFDEQSRTEFGWERWATLRGKRQYVVHYRVRQPYSKWQIVFERSMSTTPGYRGLIFVDADLKVVSRITLEAEDIPPTFPLQQARSQLDYDFTEISGRPYLLPLRAELKMRSGKDLFRNEITYQQYRKFGADTDIRFDLPGDPLPEEKLQEQPVKK